MCIIFSTKFLNVIIFVYNSKFTRDVLGQTDFTLAQVMTSQYALREAARKYKFALMPKVCIAIAM